MNIGTGSHWHSKWFFPALCVAAAGGLAVAGTLCALTVRSRAEATDARFEAETATRSRDCSVMLSEWLGDFLKNANAVPVENKEFKTLSSEYISPVQDYAVLAFRFLIKNDNLAKNYAVCAQNGLDNGCFRAVGRFLNDTEKAFAYADSRIGGTTSWHSEYEFFSNKRTLSGEEWANSPTGIRGWESAWLYGQFDISSVAAGGFRFEVFDGKIFLVREIRSSETKKFVQGFLLNENKLLAVLRTKVRCSLPGASLELASADSADISPCGLPLKFSAGTLPEEIVARADLNAFRATLVCAWGVCAALCAGALAALRLFLLSAERRRIFLAAVVHDLRSPVAGMAALSDEMLARRSGAEADFSEETRDLRRLVGRVRDLSALLDNTLLFSRIAGTRDGGDALKFRDVTAGEILPPIFERITERLDRAGTDFDTNVSDAAAAAELRVSPAALERILFNLADNAAKYAAAADVPVLTLTAEVVARSRGRKRLEIRVADNGGGLSAKARKNLFREFSRTAQDATDTGVHGLGIGLALSKKLARILGGDLVLEKSDASGTTFLLTLFPK